MSDSIGTTHTKRSQNLYFVSVWEPPAMKGGNAIPYGEYVVQCPSRDGIKATLEDYPTLVPFKEDGLYITYVSKIEGTFARRIQDD